VNAHCEIPLGKSGLVALVDVDDYELVSRYTWSPLKGTRYPFLYARRAWTHNGRRAQQLMHTLIMGATGIDHRNHNGLDNRRANLRHATQAENTYNKRPHRGSTSRFKGVSFVRNTRSWVAQIMVNRRSIYLGTFTSEEEAACAYDEAARLAFGDYAYLNFPCLLETAA